MQFVFWPSRLWLCSGKKKKTDLWELRKIQYTWKFLRRGNTEKQVNNQRNKKLGNCLSNHHLSKSRAYDIHSVKPWLKGNKWKRNRLPTLRTLEHLSPQLLIIRILSCIGSFVCFSQYSLALVFSCSLQEKWESKKTFHHKGCF